MNPEFLFSLTHSALLVDIAKGRIDPVALAKKALANRGIDDKGQWIGFEKAERFWKDYKLRPKVKRGLGL